MELVISLDWLKAFYIFVDILLLAIAIVICPTLRYCPKDDNPKHRAFKW